MTSVMNFARKTDVDETILIPIAVLSLFTLSAAIIGYLFLFQPAQMYLDGKKKEAMKFIY